MLAIETATAVCSVALLDDGVLVDANHLVVGRGHAERLLPMIAALDGGGRSDAVLVDVGPGSFTGIRVGVAAARALGFGWQVPVHGFTSLALIAATAGQVSGARFVVIEGGHGEVFVGHFRGMPLTEQSPPRSLPFAEAATLLTAPRLIGNAAARIVATRGFGEAVEVEPDARMVCLLPPAMTCQRPTPFYGRGADAKPMV